MRLTEVMVEPSSKVEWQLLVDGRTVFTSDEILDCIEQRENNNGRIISTGAKES